ncbi:hypothetical protein [Sphingomonas sp. 37zxx]|uniref:hypothetical protein n=1 Tax=Sphingomonas sp. 37zxx TaxID=1550073 RepID=UPI001E4D0CA6|nr:hypothetical protein [Sphingomonas sp. 37zxx]
MPAQFEGFGVFPRVREITDAFGSRLRISVEAHPTGALVLFERPDCEHYPQAALDGYGTEVLCGYIIAARLALPNPLPDETVDGAFASRFSLAQTEKVCLVLAQGNVVPPFEIPAPFWDRLYAELSVVIAHSRELSRRAGHRLQ